MAKDRPKPDWKKSVSQIFSPIVSVKTPSGMGRTEISRWRVTAIAVIAALLVGYGVYWGFLRADPPAVAQDEPLF